jgi:hypothetical protein
LKRSANHLLEMIVEVDERLIGGYGTGERGRSKGDKK